MQQYPASRKSVCKGPEAVKLLKASVQGTEQRMAELSGSMGSSHKMRPERRGLGWVTRAFIQVWILLEVQGGYWRVLMMRLKRDRR